MKIRKGNDCVIIFLKETHMCRSGLYTVEKILNKHHFLVTTKQGNNTILDIRQNGTSYKITSVHEIDNPNV